jgi:hypothetical protein
MTGQVLLLVTLSIPVWAGCGTLQKTSKPALVDLRPKPSHKTKTTAPSRKPKAAEAIKTTESHDKDPDIGETVAPVRHENAWLAKTRRQIAQVAKDIEADLNFHDTEGLDSFAPDARDQVRRLRGDMNGSEGIDRRSLY